MFPKIAEYDYEALSYDESRFQSELGKHIDYMHKRIIKHLLHPTSKLVLEVGVGTGRFTTWLAERDLEVIGVDISKEMLRKAKRKTQNSSKIHLILADANFLPFRKGIFDTCVSINVINHIPNVDTFLKEIKHVIKPGGFFIFNFPNLLSPYLPVAIMVNFKKQALFKKRKIFCKK